MKPLLLKTVRDLRRSPAQTLALVVVVMLGVASLIALLGAYRALNTSYNRTYEQLNFADVTFSVQSAPQDVVEDIRRIDGVAAATGRMVVDTGFVLPDTLTENASLPIRARLIGLPTERHPAVNDVLVLDGSYLKPDDTRTALLETQFAEVYDLGPGDIITPLIDGSVVSFEVAGVVASPEYLLVVPSQQELMPSARTFAVLFVPLPELQTLSGSEGAVNDIVVRFEQGAEQDALVNAIEDELTDYGLETTVLREDQPSNAFLQLDLEGYKEIAKLMPSLILVVAAASLYVMLGRRVHAQRPQIGLMKALGYSNRAILGHYISLALVVGVIGSALGIAVGLPLVRAITLSYARELGIPLIETRFYPDLVVVSVALSLFVSLLAGIGPARRSARMAPAEAMRLDPAAALVRGRPSVVERLIPLPFWLRLPVRNVFRARRRSLTTGLGVILAYMLILMSVGLLDSMEYMFANQFERVERWDVAAQFDAPQFAATLEEIGSWEGVNEIEPLLQLPVTLKVDGGEDDDLLLTAISPTQGLHVLELAGGITPQEALNDGNLVLNASTADKFDLTVGDTVTVASLFGEGALQVGGIVNEPIGGVAYISMAQVMEWSASPQPVINSVYLRVDAAETDTIKSDLFHLPDAASVQLKTDIQQDWRSLMGLFYAFIGVILAFALTMAFALLFNAMTVSVLEREREFATMRAVGTDRRRIVFLMNAENLMLWVVTLVPGLVLGHWIAVQMGAAFDSDIFSFEIVIATTSYAATAIGILLTMMLATLPPIRRINKLNLAEATKTLS